ncbi:hypothetical protein BN13_70015 [Nostocoides jenkinsii Ben 74]|uniref:Uncharacterized protein n=1 Tax=Nostocoides jenkinsii Ben 74 TaxID=1193518 RepID=A0A077MAM1_9MICO|nr:hypothetical protein BN13_70015 [Tetrasphaera jenkinsii Ben 74]
MAGVPSVPGVPECWESSAASPVG